MSAPTRPPTATASARPDPGHAPRLNPRRRRRRDRLHGVTLLQRAAPSPADLERALDQLAAEWGVEL